MLRKAQLAFTASSEEERTNLLNECMSIFNNTSYENKAELLNEVLGLISLYALPDPKTHYLIAQFQFQIACTMQNDKIAHDACLKIKNIIQRRIHKTLDLIRLVSRIRNHIILQFLTKSSDKIQAYNKSIIEMTRAKSDKECNSDDLYDLTMLYIGLIEISPFIAYYLPAISTLEECINLTTDDGIRIQRIRLLAKLCSDANIIGAKVISETMVISAYQAIPETLRCLADWENIIRYQILAGPAELKKSHNANLAQTILHQAIDTCISMTKHKFIFPSDYIKEIYKVLLSKAVNNSLLYSLYYFASSLENVDFEKISILHDEIARTFTASNKRPLLAFHQLLQVIVLEASKKHVNCFLNLPFRLSVFKRKFNSLQQQVKTCAELSPNLTSILEDNGNTNVALTKMVNYLWYEVNQLTATVSSLQKSIEENKQAALSTNPLAIFSNSNRLRKTASCGDLSSQLRMGGL